MYCRDCSNDLICPDCKTNYAVSKENNQNYLACRRCLKHEPIPKNCPNCQSEKFGTRGAGIEKMSESLRGWLEKEKILASVIIVSAEDKKTIANNRNDVNSRIFIATEAGLNRPIWSQTELAIIADFDRIRNSPDYLADERAWQLITHAHYLLKEQGELIIETREPKHYILRSLVEPHRFYRLNLNMRQTTQFPPYSLLVKYMVADRQPNLTLLRAKKALTELQTALTKADIHGNISGPTESMPKVRNGRYFYVILAKYKSDISLGAISDVHRTLSPDIKIDPNPMSLYNP
jgi:primosomal protein N' (replication factor Y)